MLFIVLLVLAVLFAACLEVRYEYVYEVSEYDESEYELIDD